MVLGQECPLLPVGMYCLGGGARADIELQSKPIVSLKSRKVFRSARYISGSDKGPFFVKFVPNISFSFGLIVTRKVGNAVFRNYLKRRIRHAIRIAGDGLNLPPTAMIVIVKKDCGVIEFLKLVKVFKSALDTICPASGTC